MVVRKILVTGAGGFVGSKLVPALLNQGFDVVAFDTFWFGNFLASTNQKLKVVAGDLRNYDLKALLEDVSHLIHLACISNDPSYELNPSLSYDINYVAQKRLIDACLRSNIQRFIFASSSSVYGVKQEDQVTEELTPEPITLYSKYKLEIEKELSAKLASHLDLLIIRPATLFGYSTRLRLDLVVNILLSQAFFHKKITVHGGAQCRPQLSIQDMISIYVKSLLYKSDFSGQIYNVGMKNYTVTEIAAAIHDLFPDSVSTENLPIVDTRSYRINCDKWNALGIHRPQIGLEAGLQELLYFFESNPRLNWHDEEFHNVKRLKNISNPGSFSLETQ